MIYTTWIVTRFSEIKFEIDPNTTWSTRKWPDIKRFISTLEFTISFHFLGISNLTGNWSFYKYEHDLKPETAATAIFYLCFAASLSMQNTITTRSLETVQQSTNFFLIKQVKSRSTTYDFQIFSWINLQTIYLPHLVPSSCADLWDGQTIWKANR